MGHSNKKHDNVAKSRPGSITDLCKLSLRFYAGNDMMPLVVSSEPCYSS